MCTDEQFLDLVEVFRDADVGITHLETVITEYDGENVYPAAEAGGTWMRAPRFIADELAWGGFDAISQASNHALDYSYGGLRSTWDALDDAGVAHAGAGENLGEARSPTYVDTENGRVGLVSMTATFTPWSRAGEARSDMRGRPGVNPVRLYYEVDAETLESIKTLAKQFGWWITKEGEEILINRHGLHNTVQRYVENEDVDGAEMTLNANDVAGNLRAVADADNRADVAIAHLHTHEFAPDGDMTVPPACIVEFAHQCADEGADVVVCQGSHAPMRGIELYEGVPIFYDPGDFFFQSDSVERLPAEFYYQHHHDLDTHPLEATPSEGFAARGLVYPWGEPASDATESASFGTEETLLHPSEGMFVGPGCTVPVCTFGEDGVERIEIYPATWLSSPESYVGIPKRATGEQATEILTYLDDLSSAFGTSIDIEGEVGVVSL
ncbi:CapA family protein [Natronobiforma cellulositropha]